LAIEVAPAIAAPFARAAPRVLFGVQHLKL
jgi:hypothetical protein